MTANMMEQPSISEDAENDAEVFQSQFDSLEIPPNIDPRLLAIWIEREQAEIERKKRKFVPPPKKSGCRKLDRLFAAYIGITVMCISVLLGLVQHRDPAAILQMTCTVFLIYTVIGFIAGIITEQCVANSVETLLRDITRKGRTAAEEYPTIDNSSSAQRTAE